MQKTNSEPKEHLIVFLMLKSSSPIAFKVSDIFSLGAEQAEPIEQNTSSVCKERIKDSAFTSSNVIETMLETFPFSFPLILSNSSNQFGVNLTPILFNSFTKKHSL